MKRHVSILPLLLILLALSACKPQVRTQDAVAYNDAIVDVQARVVDRFDGFVDAVDRSDSLGAVAALQVALDTAQAATKKLEAMPDFDGNTALRDASKALVQWYAKGLDKDFRQELPVLVSHFATLQQLEQADSVREAFSVEEDHLFELLEKAQKEFAATYKFDVVVGPQNPL